MRRDSGHGWRTAAMRPRMVSMCITLLIAVALAAYASGDERPTLRAAEAGVSPGFCPALRALVDEAPGGFSALRGAARRRAHHVGRVQAPSRRERLRRLRRHPAGLRLHALRGRRGGERRRRLVRAL